MLSCVSRSYLDTFVVDDQRLHREIHANRASVFLEEGARLEALDHARLADSRIPDQDDFKQEIENIIGLRG